MKTCWVPGCRAPQWTTGGACAALVSIARQPQESHPACGTYLVATVWEEFNLRGAMMAALAVGHYADLEALGRLVRVKGSVLPDMANHALYAPLARKYGQLYAASRHMMHEK